MEDTLKTVLEKDSIVTTNNHTIRHHTVETIKNSESNLLKDIFDSKLVITLIWPITVIVIMFSFYKGIKKILDSIGDRITKGDDFRFGKDGFQVSRPRTLKDDEVKEKLKIEIDDLIPQKEVETQDQKVESSKSKEKHVNNYFSIEKLIISKFEEFFSSRFRITKNWRVDDIEYDLVLNAPLPQDQDKIVEIKYFPSGINSVNIREALLRLSVAKNVYKKTFRKDVRPILLIVLPAEKYNLFNIAKMKAIALEQKEARNISIRFFNEAKLDSLTSEQLLDAIEE